MPPKTPSGPWRKGDRSRRGRRPLPNSAVGLSMGLREEEVGDRPGDRPDDRAGDRAGDLDCLPPSPPPTPYIHFHRHWFSVATYPKILLDIQSCDELMICCRKASRILHAAVNLHFYCERCSADMCL